MSASSNIKKYNGFLLATAGSVVAASSGAQAADLAVKAPPAPVATWDGWYVGINAGAAWQRATGAYGGEVDDSGNGTSLRGNNNNAGFAGGGQIGYNWQRGMSVFGVEADIEGLTGSANSTGNLGFNNGSKGAGLTARINWLSTFRARAGWLMDPATLFYATGGLAVGGVRDTFAPNGVGASCTASFCQKSASKTAVGWTAGAGIEHQMARNWTIGLEALYVDLGRTTGGNSSTTKTSTFRNSTVLGRVKLNLKF